MHTFGTILLAVGLAGPGFLVFAVLAAFAIKRTQKKGYATTHLISVMHAVHNTPAIQ